MNRYPSRALALAGALLLLPALAAAVAGVTRPHARQPTPHTRAPGRVYCTDCGYPTDRVRFPGGADVTPTSWSLNSHVDVRVPATWSGTIQLQKQGLGSFSNAWPHDIYYSWSQTRWLSLPFTWSLHSAGAPGVGFNATRDALIRGYTAWECASGLTTTFGGSTAVAATANDGVNCRYWSSVGWSPSTVAVATWWSVIATGEIVEADIAFNSQHYTWSTTGLATAMDVQNVGTHEEGHTIGLLDEYGDNDADDTMYGFVADGEVSRRTLHTDDVLGAEFMHPHTRADLANATPAGWTGPIVPRATPDATGASALLPAALPGNIGSYVNFGMGNIGSDCASPSSLNNVFLDGVLTWTPGWTGTFGAGSTLGLWLNNPALVRGGRHTFTQVLDVNEEVAESSESNNTFNAQFVWSPLVLADQGVALRAAPPDDGTGVYPNCDGIQGTGHWWGCLAAVSAAATDDYDVVLYDDYSGSLAGFQSPLASSFSPAGRTDFVLWNGNVVGADRTHYGGIERFAAPAASPAITNFSAVVGPGLVPGTSYGASVSTPLQTITANQLVKVYEVFLGTTSTTYQFTLDHRSGAADLDMGLYSKDGDYFRRIDYERFSQSLGAGIDEGFSYLPPAAGFYAVVVWKRGSADAPLSATFTLSVGPALSNVSAVDLLAGSSATTLATQAALPSGGPYVVSPTLTGEASAHLYYYSRFEGPNPTPGFAVDMRVDEVSVWEADLPAQTTPLFNVFHLPPGPLSPVLAGGRHTLTHAVDPDAELDESDETDNAAANQYVWQPAPAFNATPLALPAPPAPGAGPYPNSNARRYDRTTGYAWVSSMAPAQPADDYDLLLHDDYLSSTSGLSNLRAESALPGNATDFVVGTHNSLPHRWYPTVVRAAGAGAGYALDQVDSQDRVNGIAVGEFLDQPLAAGRLADVYEVQLVAGQIMNVVLHCSSGSDDLTFSLFPPTAGAVFPRSGALATANVWAADKDTLEFQAEATGWHALVVYRTDGTQASEALTYTLAFSTGRLVDAPGEDLPVNLAFTGPFPNPVQPSSRLAFTLPQGGHVRLDIFDLGGRSMTTLADRSFEPGRHDVGLPGAGLTPGLYWARLHAAGRVLTRRFTVLAGH